MLYSTNGIHMFPQVSRPYKQQLHTRRTFQSGRTCSSKPCQSLKYYVQHMYVNEQYRVVSVISVLERYFLFWSRTRTPIMYCYQDLRRVRNGSFRYPYRGFTVPRCHSRRSFQGFQGLVETPPAWISTKGPGRTSCRDVVMSVSRLLYVATMTNQMT